MPIGKDEWDAGRTWEVLEARILTFLRKNRNKGFTSAEIFQGLGYRVTSDFWGVIAGLAGFWALQTALDSLVKEKTVMAKIIKKAVGEETYYMAT